MLKLISNKNMSAKFTPADYRFSLNRYSAKIKKAISRKVLCYEDIEKVYQQLVIDAFKSFPKHSITSFEYYWFVALSEVTISRYYGQNRPFAIADAELKFINS
jgi:DNA-directed RNA polymerase specialized sigma24 family protein